MTKISKQDEERIEREAETKYYDRGDILRSAALCNAYEAGATAERERANAEIEKVKLSLGRFINKCILDAKGAEDKAISIIQDRTLHGKGIANELYFDYQSKLSDEKGKE